MRLVTANLWNGRVDPDGLARHLDEVKPDVMVAQEVGPKQAEMLADRFPHGAVEGRTDTNGCALMSVHELLVESLPLPHRPAYRGVTEVDGREVEILGVHLSNPIQGIDAPWGVGERRRQLSVLEPLVSGPGRRIVAGDLNATPIWAAYRRLTSHLLDGIARWAREEGRTPPRTWGPRPWTPALLRIDHVLVRGLRVTGVRVDRMPGGDHRAVTVEIEPAGP